VKDPADDGGGGPAGVVEGLEAPKKRLVDFLSGVDGAGLEE
jgi:hypothetical protein